MVSSVRGSGPIAGTRTSSRAGVARQSAGLRKTGAALELERRVHFSACNFGNRGLFFGPDQERQKDRGQREEAAKKVCAGCPIRRVCLDFALETEQKFGIYGGLNEDERAEEARRRAAGGSS